MTQEQIREADEVFPLLGECREHLDNAMYRMGDVSSNDPDFKHIREVYNRICKLIDFATNRQ